MSLSPLREPDIRCAAVRLGDDGIDKFVARVVCFSLGIQSVAPITIRSFAICIDSNRFRKPYARSIERVAAKLSISRLIPFLEFHIADVKSRFIEPRIEPQGLPV